MYNIFFLGFQKRNKFYFPNLISFCKLKWALDVTFTTNCINLKIKELQLQNRNKIEVTVNKHKI